MEKNCVTLQTEMIHFTGKRTLKTRYDATKLALLCAVAQGTWAQIPDPTVFDDVWDGRSTSKPEFYSGWFEVNPAYKYYDVVIIKKASELAYVRDNFKSYEKKDILLMANLDMGAVSWIPMGNDNGSITSYWGTFYGNGHTIRIVIKDATANYQVDLGDGATPTSIVINFGDGEVTGITDPTPAWEGSGNAWFTLDGRKLGSKKTAQKGVYIYKGAKIVIK